MKYMVMECHKSFAIVLDEDGNFLKVANLRYQVGQTVYDVIEMNTSKNEETIPKVINLRKLAYAVAAMAACFSLFLISNFLLYSKPYASMYLTINPSVRIDVDKEDRVKNIEGENEDGKALIDGYRFQNKTLDAVLDELLDKSVEMGYLTTGKTIRIRFDTKDDVWRMSHEESISSHIRNHLQDQFEVEIIKPDDSDASESALEQSNTIVIPVTPTFEETGLHPTNRDNDEYSDDANENIDDDADDSPDDDVPDVGTDDDSDDIDGTNHESNNPDDRNDDSTFDEHIDNRDDNEDDDERNQNPVSSETRPPANDDGQSDYSAEANPQPQTSLDADSNYGDN